VNVHQSVKTKIGFITASFFLLHQALSFAAPLDLSLEASVGLALENNPAIQIAVADKEKSQWGIREAKGAKMPSVSLGSSYSLSEHDGNMSGESDINNSLRLNWQVYTGGRIEGQIKQAELGLNVADLNVEEAKQQIKLDTTTAYYNVLQTSNLLSVNQETVHNLNEHLKIAQAKYEAGIVAKSDVLRSEVEMANAEQNLTKSQNNYDLAISSLLNIMNIDANTEVFLQDQLQHVPYDKTLEENLIFANGNRPDIAQAQTNISIADSGLNVAKSGKRPTVSLSASTGWSNSLLPDTNDWSVGASANWNIFDAGVNHAKLKQAETSLDKARLQAEQVINNVEQEVRQSYLSMKEAEKRMETTNVAVGKAAEDLYIAQEKYTAGVGTNLDAIDAQLMLTQAKTNHIQALYDFNVNKAKLDKAIGAKPE